MDEEDAKNKASDALQLEFKQMKYIQRAKTESEQAKQQKDKYQKETEDEK